MDDNKFWLALWMTVVVGFVVMVLGSIYLTFWHDHRMAELGYQETVVQGSGMPHWQKAPAVK